MAGPVLLLGADPSPSTPAVVAQLLAGRSMVVLPTPAAFVHPARAAAHVAEWLGGHGIASDSVMVLNRRDASDPAVVAKARDAAGFWITDGTAMHARSVLKETPLWEAMGEAHGAGAAIVGSGSGAMLLTDPMADERGGGLTLGLGLLSRMAVVAGHAGWPAHMVRRIRDLAGDVPVVTLGDDGAVVLEADRWSAHGFVEVHHHGAPAGLDVLAAR